MNHPLGRLCLVSGVPVISSDCIAKTSIFYTPYLGNTLPVHDGAGFVERKFSEIELHLDADTAHAGYHEAGKNYDLFIFDDNGTLRLGSGPAWTTDTSRVAAVSRVDGVLVNFGANCMRWGANATDISTVPAHQATYLGTFRASENGQTQFDVVPPPVNGGTNNKMYLWNQYNRVEMHSICRDLLSNWIYTGSAFRPSNNSDNNRISLVCGFVEDAISAYFTQASSNTLGGVLRRIALAFNGYTNTNTETFISAGAGEIVSGTSVMYRRPPNAGFNRIQAIERSNTSGVTKWYGGGDQELRVTFWM
jgi:hypothetical protein